MKTGLATRTLLLVVCATMCTALVGCGNEQRAQVEAGDPTPTVERTATPSPVAVDIPPVTDALREDARYYAEDMGVDLDQAVLRLPDRVEIVISPLPEALEGTVEPTPTPIPTIAVSTPTPEPTPTKVAVVSEATLPVLTLEYKGVSFEGYRFEGCWTENEQSDIQCVRTSPHNDVVDAYMEIARGDAIAVRITPDNRPEELFVHILTEPGNISVSDLMRLLPVEHQFVMDTTPGRYNVWVHAHWFEGKADIQYKVSYVFGLSIPGEAELRRQCEKTIQGGILGIVLDSPDDRDRTALEAVNDGGCRFNKEIMQVRLTLESVDTEPYVETFQIEPPSSDVGFPLRDEFTSERTGGPLLPGEYSRRVVVMSVAGDEMDISDMFNDVSIIKLADGAPDSDPQIVFPQHREERQAISTSRPDHIEGSLQARNGCVYVGYRHIPVWPSDFSFRVEEGRVQILGENGAVAARQGSRVILRGREVKVDDPAGREIGRTLPLYCPPGNYWIVAD